MDPRNPTPTGHAILGLLSFGQPLAGYEIRQWSLGMLRHFYPAPAQSQIYRELAMLEETGRVTSTPIEQTDRPDTVVYSLTAAGREALSSWVEAAPVAPTGLKHHVALRVFLGHNTSPPTLVEMLEAHRATVLATLDQLETMSVALGEDADAAHAAIAADWTAEIYRGDLRGVERALKALAERGDAGAGAG